MTEPFAPGTEGDHPPLAGSYLDQFDTRVLDEVGAGIMVAEPSGDTGCMGITYVNRTASEFFGRSWTIGIDAIRDADR